MIPARVRYQETAGIQCERIYIERNSYKQKEKVL